MALGGVSIANAADLNWVADTTVTIDGANYTILSGSEAESMIVGATTLAVEVASGDWFTLTSSDRYRLNNNQSIDLQCSTSVSKLKINGPKIVVITPNTGSTCSVGSVSGGYIAPAVPATLAIPAVPATPAQVICSAGHLFNTATGAPCSTSVQVICPAGHLFSTATGARCTTVSGASGTADSGGVSAEVKAINTDLTEGSTGDLVQALQQFLIDQNKGEAALALSANGTTINFGNLTKAALAEWQKAMGISPAVGFYGPITRAKIKALTQ